MCPLYCTGNRSGSYNVVSNSNATPCTNIVTIPQVGVKFYPGGGLFLVFAEGDFLALGGSNGNGPLVMLLSYMHTRRQKGDTKNVSNNMKATRNQSISKALNKVTCENRATPMALL